MPHIPKTIHSIQKHINIPSIRAISNNVYIPNPKTYKRKHQCVCAVSLMLFWSVESILLQASCILFVITTHIEKKIVVLLILKVDFTAVINDSKFTVKQTITAIRLLTA